MPGKGRLGGDGLAGARTPLHTLSLRLDHGRDVAAATAGAAGVLAEGLATTGIPLQTLALR